MITLTRKNAHDVLNCLGSGGAEGRARKAVLQYTRSPSGDLATAAVAVLATLPDGKRHEVKSVARS